jgi:Uma2 family endonuclease
MITSEDLKHFLRIVPAFIIELHSESQTLAESKAKMEMWMANGVKLGWLVDPQNRSVHTYQTDSRSEATGDHVTGGGPVPGFTLDLTLLW